MAAQTKAIPEAITIIRNIDLPPMISSPDCRATIGHVQENGGKSALIIQPTTKFLKAGTILAFLVVLALDIALYVSSGWSWIMIPPAFILLWPAMRAIRWRFSKTT